MPALAQAAAMPLLEETTLPQEHPPTVPVVIIGKCFVLTFDGFTLLLLTTNILNLKNTGQETKPRFPKLGLFSGNGPSGICLSYLLSGYKPYLDTATVHPNPILYRKLQETKHLPITEQVKNTCIFLVYVQMISVSQVCHDRDLFLL